MLLRVYPHVHGNQGLSVIQVFQYFNDLLIYTAFIMFVQQIIREVAKKVAQIQNGKRALHFQYNGFSKIFFDSIFCLLQVVQFHPI